jgi:adenine-specific DNA methylase
MMVKSLIEQWFPAAYVGAESLRERGAASALPPVNFLHVWWARRPLTASRASVVASLLPAWPTDDDVVNSEDAARVRAGLEAEFSGGESAYHRWFVESLGIMGDPVAARRLIRDANERGVKLKGNGYGYDRAFKQTPNATTIDRFRRLAALNQAFDGAPTVLDPFSGGGSIPFEAARFGCTTIANELNPVAAAVLNGTVALPGRLGQTFGKVIQDWGDVWAQRVGDRLAVYFPKATVGESVIAYIWAHSVPCPSTGHQTPLSPNYWLATGKAGRSVAVQLHPNAATGEITTSIVEGKAAKEHGDRSTYSRGSAQSVFDPTATFDGDYIKEMATTGRMGQILLAVSVTRPSERGRQFREPSDADRAAVTAAEEELAANIARWEIEGRVPDEAVHVGQETERSVAMGITRWRDFFTPRQLLTQMVFSEELEATLAEAAESLDADTLKALALYLAFAIDKSVDYNSRASSWHSSRLTVRNTFDRHDFAFKWSFTEFDGASALLPWAIDQVVDAYQGIANLSRSEGGMLSPDRESIATVLRGSAAELAIPDGSVDAVVTDPPYYDNVMYGECSDYFYVWLKRSLRSYWPELCDLVLSDKQNEAVANKSLFKDLADPGARGRREGDGMSAIELADQRYEELLAAAFGEAHRVLKDDGVMTVMFTHKRVDAWDTLGAALLDGGFEISSSWPVHTESEHSLHQAKKNSASSTILLGCRKRKSTEPAYWTDIQGEVEDAAEEAAQRFSADGIKGVDLTLATYGPALSVLSRNWPVYTGNLDESGNREIIRPDVALDRAREKVALLKKRELLGGRDVEFDRATDWWLLAWNDFQAAQFPAGEALKLCIATDLDLEDVSRGHKLVKAASGNVTIQSPAQRRTSRALDPDAGEWPTMIDALHAFMLIYDEDGLQAAERWLQQTGRKDDERFAALVEAAIHAVPRAREKNGEFARPEARILESLRAVLFDHIEAPDTEELSQPSLFDED